MLEGYLPDLEGTHQIISNLTAKWVDLRTRLNDEEEEKVYALGLLGQLQEEYEVREPTKTDSSFSSRFLYL